MFLFIVMCFGPLPMTLVFSDLPIFQTVRFAPGEFAAESEAMRDGWAGGLSEFSTF